MFASDNVVVPFWTQSRFPPPPQEKTAWLQHLKAHDKRNPHPQAAEESLSLCAADEWVTLRERCSALDSNGENLTKPS